MGNLCLNNALCFVDGCLRKGNLLLAGGKIVAFSQQPYSAARGKLLDCQEQWVLPGCIDGHVHFRCPGFEDKEDWGSGSRAALVGGVTSVIDMPNTNPPTTTLTTLNQKRRIAAESSRVHFGFHFGACTENLDSLGDIDRIASIKVYFGSSTGSLLVNAGKDLEKVCQNAKVGISFHAEDEQMIQAIEKTLQEHDYQQRFIHNRIRSITVAESALHKILEHTKSFRLPIYICHISTRREHEIITAARETRKIYCEATPQHLFCTKDIAQEIGNFSKVNPPLRDEADRVYLMQAFKEQRIDSIGTDHAPHQRQEKLRDYTHTPSGMPGLETCLPLLLTEVSRGNLAITDIVKRYSEKPAEIFSIKNKAKIHPGYDADLIVIKPTERWTCTLKDIQSKAAWNPFLGRQFTGRVTQVFIKGQCAYKTGQFYTTPGEELQYTKL